MHADGRDAIPVGKQHRHGDGIRIGECDSDPDTHPEPYCGGDRVVRRVAAAVVDGATA